MKYLFTKHIERLWKIEGVMNELKNHNGLLRVKYRGINNVQIQAYMTAIAINIKRQVFFVLIRFLNYMFKKTKICHLLQQTGTLSISNNKQMLF